MRSLLNVKLYEKSTLWFLPVSSLSWNIYNFCYEKPCFLPPNDNNAQINILFSFSFDDTVKESTDITLCEKFSRDDRTVSDAVQREQIVLRTHVDRLAAGNSPGDNGVRINEVRNDRAKSLDLTLRSRELGEFITRKGTCREIAKASFIIVARRGDTRFARLYPFHHFFFSLCYDSLNISNFQRQNSNALISWSRCCNMKNYIRDHHGEIKMRM